MKKCKFLSTLSYFLIFAILITGLPVWARAASTEDDETTPVLSVDDVPEVMSYAELTAAGHISRVYADESELNTVVFENADSTRTAYILGEDVKYVGSDGKVYDKSNHLTRSSDGTYKNLKNDISVTYPAKIADGITVQYKGIEIVITPQGASNTAIPTTLHTEEIDFSKKDIVDTLTYTGAFGSNTCIEYIQTFTGFKENIYLASKPENNVFNFTVLTNGASVELRDGVAVLISDGEVVGDFGKVYVYDANGTNCYGETVVTAAKPNQLYVLSISIPVEFLESTATQYPVVVDPSVTLRDSTVKIVEDATVFANYNTNVGSSPYLFVGNLDGSTPFYDRGLTKVAVKFPLLNSNTSFKQLYNAGRIESVKYNFADVDCTGTNTILAKRITVNWSENTVVYSTVANNTSSTTTSSVSVTARTATTPYPRYELNILPFIEEYGTSGIAQKGILLEVTNTTGDTLSIGASESGELDDDDSLSSSKPYVTYTYYAMPTGQTAGVTSGQTFLLINNATGKAISYNTSLSQATPNGADTKQYFKITYIEEDGGYQISPVNNAAQCLKATSSGLTVTSSSTTPDYLWYIYRTNDGYRIHSAGSANKVLTTTGSTSTVTAANDKDGSIWTISIKPIRQMESDTCSSAVGTMVLRHFGCDTTESAFKSKAESLYNEQWNFAYAVRDTINFYLNQEQSNTAYRSLYRENYEDDEIFEILRLNIDDGLPVVLSVKINNTTTDPFYYDTPRHYILITGAFYSESGVAMVVVNDPFDKDYNEEEGTGGPNTYVMAFSDLYDVLKPGGYIICVKS